MGASSWRYYTPHRPDPEAALQELRRDVFARRDYSMGMGGFARAGGPAPGAVNPLDLLNSGMFGQVDAMARRILEAVQSGDLSGLSDQERLAAEQLRPMLQLLQLHGAASRAATNNDEDDEGEEQPETIEELLEMVAEDGTHSILDIEHVADRLDFGVAAPLPESLIAQAFGSTRPTREQVEAGWGAIAEPLDRWQAYYLAIYRDGQPAEYAFIGCSGD